MEGRVSNVWSAEGYERNASFVPALGAAVLELLAPRADERILDLGCGDGVLTEKIVAAGASVVGVDVSESMIAVARGRGLDVRFMRAEALDFDGEFDAVFTNAVLHWVADAEGVVAGVHRALKPGGRFVGEFGGHGNIAAINVALRAVAREYGRQPDMGWFYPTAPEYRELLERGGFRVLRAELIPRPTPLPTGMYGWLDTFRGTYLSQFPLDARERVVELLRPVLCDGSGQWTADYVRLRFAAEKS